MGMYTELVLNVRFRHDTPEQVLNVLEVLTDPNGEYKLEGLQALLPDHPVLSKPRAHCLFHCCSHYFIPESFVRFFKDDIAGCWFLMTRFDLKNYDGEIEALVEFIRPYVEGSFMGYKRYEEDLVPTLLFTEPQTGVFQAVEAR